MAIARVSASRTMARPKLALTGSGAPASGPSQSCSCTCRAMRCTRAWALAMSIWRRARAKASSPRWATWSPSRTLARRIWANRRCTWARGPRCAGRCSTSHSASTRIWRSNGRSPQAASNACRSARPVSLAERRSAPPLRWRVSAQTQASMAAVSSPAPISNSSTPRPQPGT